MEDQTNIDLLVDITQKNFTLNKNQKYAIEKFWKNLYTDFKNENIEIYYSHNTHFIDEKYLSNKIMYLRQINEKEIEDWNKALIKGKWNNRTFKLKGKNNLLLIYRETNLDFRIISEEGIIFKVQNVPVSQKLGIKNYDIYIAKKTLNK